MGKGVGNPPIPSPPCPLSSPLTRLDGAGPAIHHLLDDDLKEFPVPQRPGGHWGGYPKTLEG